MLKGWLCVQLVAVRRTLCTTTILPYKTDKASLSKLRKKTGYSFSNCKKALEKFQGDSKQAEKWLKDEAQKQGWAKAIKLQGRPMSQGLIGIIHDTGTHTAAMVEVNCETDFVSRNTKFQSLVAKITGLCYNHVLALPDSNSKILLDTKSVGELPAEGRTVADIVAMELPNIGENMTVRRAAGFKSDAHHIGSYIHASGPAVRSSKCQLGKYGALVLYTSSTPDSKQREAFGQRISQHVVGMNPDSIGCHDDDPNDDIEEETKLIFQEYMLDPELRVKDILRDNEADVVDFVRFECGEDLEKEEKCSGNEKKNSEQGEEVDDVDEKKKVDECQDEKDLDQNQTRDVEKKQQSL